jgi:AcrR family transcriptional regulator
MAPASTRSNAPVRRERTIAAALPVFARTGFHATSVADVAARAGISPAYVYRLFDSKLGLFVATLEHCFALVRDALERGADAADGGTPEEILHAMGGAYAHLIHDRDLLAMQLQALSACEIPEIRAAVRAGLAATAQCARRRSLADDEAIESFMAYGQLCHVIVLAGVEPLR